VSSRPLSDTPPSCYLASNERAEVSVAITALKRLARALGVDRHETAQRSTVTFIRGKFQFCSTRHRVGMSGPRHRPAHEEQDRR
jgi:hypothetical protein